MNAPSNTPNNASTPDGGAPPARGLVARFADLFVKASLVGVAASILLHVAAGLLAAGIVVVAVGGGGGRGSTVSVDVPLALLSESELREIESASLTPLAAPTPDLPGFEPPKIDLSTAGATSPASSPADLNRLAGAGSGGSGVSGSSGDDGFGEGLGGAGGGGARFFGVEARGSRIAYIVDVSGSMAGPKLETLKSELSKSIDALLEHASFAVMLFSSEARPLDGSNRWSDASTKGKRGALQRINAIVASGGTNPEHAFEMVFALRPKPDAVYFMTDGLFAAEIALQIETLNRAAGPVTPIHCIAFVSQEAESLLRGIARSSDGTYTYVSGP